MAEIENKDMVQKPFHTKIKEIDQYRELITKPFKEIDTGDVYQLLFFAHNSKDTLCAVLALSAHTKIKLTIPVSQFAARFEEYDNMKG